MSAVALGYEMVMWPVWRHVTLKGQGRDPDIFGCKYLENGWR